MYRRHQREQIRPTSRQTGQFSSRPATTSAAPLAVTVPSSPGLIDSSSDELAEITVGLNLGPERNFLKLNISRVSTSLTQLVIQRCWLQTTVSEMDVNDVVLEAVRELL